MESNRDILPAQVVFSKAGRDKGKAFVALGRAGPGEVWIADGLGRTAEKPKRKKIKHLQGAGGVNETLYRKLRDSEKVENCLIREILKKYEKPCAGCGGSCESCGHGCGGV